MDIIQGLIETGNAGKSGWRIVNNKGAFGVVNKRTSNVSYSILNSGTIGTGATFVNTYNSTSSPTPSITASPSATTTGTTGNHTYHVFTYTTDTAGAGTGQSLYTITVPTGGVVCDVLVVGGGGNGGNGENANRGAGGGGAGGLIYIQGVSLIGTYTITVGKNEKNSSITTTATNQININGNLLTTLIATAGGRGGTTSASGAVNGIGGGSGGGGADWNGVGANSTQNTYFGTGFGFKGGNSSGMGYGDGGAGAGGGGAGGIGSNQEGYTRGLGGPGKNIDITGTQIEYAVGGNGSTIWSNNGVNGINNRGNGGAGAGRDNLTGGTGGTGIVIIRYLAVSTSSSISLIQEPNLNVITNYVGGVTSSSSGGGSSQWTTIAGSKIYYNNGNVGIGTIDPIAPLHIYNNTTTAILPTEIVVAGATSATISGTTDRYISFPYSGSATTKDYTFTTTENLVCDILIVGGGGAGGSRHAGGGGAGAVIYLTNQTLSPGSYSISVGNGGAGAVPSGSSGAQGNKGGDSSVSFNSTTIYLARGGGAGYHGLSTGNSNKDGGSGGGGGETAGVAVSTNTPSGTYGNSGGTLSTPTTEADYAGGGGGGAAAAGANGSAINATGIGGKGGDGRQLTINGTATYYGGGGGGGIALGGNTAGAGGLGGGGPGSKGTVAATNGTDGTGGGGGGGGFSGATNGAGGRGGSGIVIIRYRRQTQPIVSNARLLLDATTTGSASIEFRRGTGADAQNDFRIINDTNSIIKLQCENSTQSFSDATANIVWFSSNETIIHKNTTMNGRVGIGTIYNTTIPSRTLDVVGDANISGILTAGSLSASSATITNSITSNTSLNITNGFVATLPNEITVPSPIPNEIVVSPLPTEIVVAGTTFGTIGTTDRYISFPYSGTGATKDYTFTTTENLICDILVVGGGGGGSGTVGGGGGAGALIFAKNAILSNGTYTISVGSGGIGGASERTPVLIATKGNSSSISKDGINITAEGGGASGRADGNQNGGSGGGGDYWAGNETAGTSTSYTSTAFGASIVKYGNNGANAYNISPFNGGGGGGAGSSALKATSTNQFSNGGSGLHEVIIDGITINFASIFGTNTAQVGGVLSNGNLYYGGGGGAGGQDQATGGTGGIGGGGNGGPGSSGSVPPYIPIHGSNGFPNTGGGGGGGSNHNSSGGNGGSGIVIIRYRKPPSETVVSGTIAGTTDRYISFPYSGTGATKDYTITTTENLLCDILIVGGGGGGGASIGSGGGGGGLLYYTGLTITANTYTISVGNGGTGATNYLARGANGSNSSAVGYTAYGGGGGGGQSWVYNQSNTAGGTLQTTSANQGSGGGGTRYKTLGNSGTSGQGNSGGNSSSDQMVAGGGGGAGGVGGTAQNTIGGLGGAGTYNSITGSSIGYAGGGAGSGGNEVKYGALATEGGGNSGPINGSGGFLIGGAGTNGRGGGGGGGVDSGGNGGSGIIIIRYRKPPSETTVSAIIPGTTDRYISFPYSGTAATKDYTITTTENLVCDILVVGGGGTGGNSIGGGGGAGGVVYAINQTLPIGTYTVKIGRGGIGTIHPGGDGQGSIGIDQDGQDSFIQLNNTDLIFSMGGVNQSVRGKGGGGGGIYYAAATVPGRAGGSGGGAGERENAVYNGGISTQGNTYWDGSSYVAGGSSGYGNLTSDGNYFAAGGGGAGNTQFDNIYNGKTGVQINITGTPRFYAAGGGGGQLYATGGTAIVYTTRGLGGSSIGGNGRIRDSASYTREATSGVDGTGSGGGGGAYNATPFLPAGSGGSGIIIIRYRRQSSNQSAALELTSSSSTSIIEPIAKGIKQFPETPSTNADSWTDNGFTVTCKTSDAILSPQNTFYLFNNLIASPDHYHGAQLFNGSSPFNYTSSTSFKGANGLVLYIDLGRSITLRNMRIAPRDNTSHPTLNFLGAAPGIFKIYASNDSASWTSTTHASWTEIHSQTTSLTFNYNQFTSFGNFSSITTPYRYFAMVVYNLSGNYSYLTFSEWDIFGTYDMTPVVINSDYKYLSFTYDSTTIEQKTGVSGWRLVRFLPPTATAWHPINDNLAGTTTYGTAYNNTNAWSIPFGTFDEFCFSTFGLRYWLYTTKNQAIGQTYSAARTIIRSSISIAPYTALWYNRGAGNPEDPWIGLRDHALAPASNPDAGGDLILYGENSFSSSHWSLPAISVDGGICVWVRNSAETLALPSQTSYTVNFPESTLCDILVVGGGGGGGNDRGGGGGGGGVIYSQNITLNGAYTINVGKEGVGTTSGTGGGTGTRGTNGSNSSISGSNITTITAIGGGGGGACASGVIRDGLSGGSGGGGSQFNGAGSGGTGTSGQGRNGGIGFESGAGGGGGGAVNVGNDANSTNAGNGGLGLSNTITNSAVIYGSGGGGGGTSPLSYGGSIKLPGTGGSSGAGNGGGVNANGVNATIFGCGGGGGGVANGSVTTGGNGFAGVVIIRYKSTKSGNQTYKVGNYNGEFKVISSVSNTDTDYIKITSAGAITNPMGTASWNTGSDRRIKENIERASYDKCFENINRLELNRFNYIDGFNTVNRDKTQLGFIAQEVSDIFPKSISSQEYYSNTLNIPDLLSIDITQINYSLYGAVKKLIEINIEKDIRIITLNNRIKILKNLLNITDDAYTSNIILGNDSGITITDNNTSNIVADTIVIDANTSNIVADTIVIDANTSNIVADTIVIDANTSNIVVDTIVIDANTSNIVADTIVIDANTSNIVADTIVIDANTSNIVADTIVIDANTSNIVADTIVIDANTSNIVADTIVIDANTSNIVADTIVIDANTSNIVADTIVIDANTSNIVSDTIVIDANTSNIVADTIVIDANTSNIVSDTIVIDTTTSNIASNE